MELIEVGDGRWGRKLKDDPAQRPGQGGRGERGERAEQE
jgi:hypothetical protein